jgi:hypothetical protein
MVKELVLETVYINPFIVSSNKCEFFSRKEKLEKEYRLSRIFQMDIHWDMTMGAEEFGRIAITIQVYMILMKWRVDVEFKEFPIYQCHNFKVEEEEEEEESKFQIEDDELCTKRKNANNATGISWRKWHQEFLHGVGIKHDNSENSYNIVMNRCTMNTIILHGREVQVVEMWDVEDINLF